VIFRGKAVSNENKKTPLPHDAAVRKGIKVRGAPRLGSIETFDAGHSASSDRLLRPGTEFRLRQADAGQHHPHRLLSMACCRRCLAGTADSQQRAKQHSPSRGRWLRRPIGSPARSLTAIAIEARAPAPNLESLGAAFGAGQRLSAACTLTELATTFSVAHHLARSTTTPSWRRQATGNCLSSRSAHTVSTLPFKSRVNRRAHPSPASARSAGAHPESSCQVVGLHD
jgi:hypothetical protein